MAVIERPDFLNGKKKLINDQCSAISLIITLAIGNLIANFKIVFQHEDVSKYKSNIELNGRYLLLNLLGKGGFSEVYKAYDSEEQLMVAIKIHQLNQDWTEQKKADYQRHARREAEIQKSINHPKIVRLYDRFEVDINTLVSR